jgi:hypothetical protein
MTSTIDKINLLKPKHGTFNVKDTLDFNDNIQQEKDFVDMAEKTTRKVISKSQYSDVYLTLEAQNSSKVDEWDREIENRENNLKVCEDSYQIQCQYFDNAFEVLQQCKRNLESKKQDMKLQIVDKKKAIKTAKHSKAKEILRIHINQTINKIFS